MKVCHFISTSANGAYFKNLLGGLAKNGIIPICVELGDYKPPQWLDEIPQAKYFNLNVHSKSRYPLAVLRLARLLRKEKVDILQSHLYDAGLIGVIAGRLARTPIVILTRHHTSIVKILGKKYHTMLDRLMADKSDGVVVVSDAVRRFMKESDGVKKNHIEIIHIGFDFEKLNATEADREKVRNELSFTPDAFVIGYVAQFIKGKGHPQLVEAFGQIVKEIPEARLMLVGSQNHDTLDKVIDDLMLKDKIVFTGWRDDISACIKAMDVFVQPSLSEAFSQVIIETMATGTPLVATDVGGAREVITHGENALIVPPNEPAEIAKAVISLYKNRQFSEKLAANAQKHVRETFTVEKMVNKQIDFYNKHFGKIRGKG